MDITQVILLLSIVVGSLALFISDKFPIEGVAFLVLVALLTTGLVGEDRILDGFSNPATMTVAAMFVMSAGLQRTGVVRWIAHRLGMLVGQHGGSLRIGSVLGVTTGALSAFINNTATVSVLLPVALRLCRERKVSPTKVLMTLSFAAQFGGVCTLIGTTTNLLVNTFALSAGLPSFGMFEFAQVGLICFGVGMAYMLLVGQFILPDRVQTDDQTTAFGLRDYVTEMKVLTGSSLIDQNGADNDLSKLGEDVHILEIIRDGKLMWAPKATNIKEGDILLIRGSVDVVMDAVGRLKLEDWAEGKLSDQHLESDDVGLVEVLLPRGSKLLGKTLTQLDFYWRYHAAVLGVRRHDAVLKKRIADIPFEEGDMLLLQGHKDDLKKLQEERDFMFLNDLSTMRLKKKRAVVALMLMALFVVAASSGMFSILTAALMCAAAMVMTRCLSTREAYQSFNIPVILLLACLIPLGIAMQSTGAATWLADTLLSVIGKLGPTASLAGVYVMTMVLTAVMSNTATAALLAPIALGLATALDVNPQPFLVAVAFAASSCFTTPVGYQTNMMVYTPGGYKYKDFLKVGLPLNLIFMLLTVFLIPKFWAF